MVVQKGEGWGMKTILVGKDPQRSADLGMGEGLQMYKRALSPGLFILSRDVRSDEGGKTTLLTRRQDSPTKGLGRGSLERSSLEDYCCGTHVNPPPIANTMPS